MTSLEIRGLRKSFGSQVVLDGLDLSVRPGSFTALLGPSGSGKTTLLRVVAGFERADSGLVRLGAALVDGDGAFVPPEKRRIGYVPQEGSLFPHLTVERNISFGLPRPRRPASGSPGGASATATRVAELLEMVGLDELGRRYPHQLSGGQQQRVALARALATNPEVVLLDEPFSSLDASLRASVRSDVRSVLREAGTTALLVTHDQDEALSLADEVAIIHEGRIDQHATPQELYRRPVAPALASALGESNLLAGAVEAGAARVTTAVGDAALDAGSTARFGSGSCHSAVVLVRPEQLDVRPLEAPGVAGRVVAYEFYGHDAVIRILVDDVGTVVARLEGDDEPLAPGRLVRLGVRGPVVAWPAAEVATEAAEAATEAAEAATEAAEAAKE